MDEKVESYRLSLNKDVKQYSIDNHKSFSDAFMEIAVGKLESYGIIQDPNIYQFSGSWEHNKAMAISGYYYDNTDNSLSLFLSDYSDDEGDTTINTEQVNKLLYKMWHFLEACIDDTLCDYTDNEEIVRIGRNMRANILKSYTDSDIDRIKFFILTNRYSNTKKKTTSLKENPSIKKDISYQIWGVERFYSNDSGGKEREPLLIDFRTECGLEHGIPFLKANVSGRDEYESYLCIIPGKTLAMIYHKYGSVLLEQNVRAYLGSRSKINKGILKTIKLEPSKFFIYNNGISVTGHSVQFESDENNNQYISQIFDMQIINGGQTTASLYTAYMNDRASLDDIYVQMKLTVIKHDEDYDDLVGNISRYSNSQTTVKASDFFSAHPFHRKLEQLSKSTPSPNPKGYSMDTYWYYERTRGKYNQETYKDTESAKKKFMDSHPKKQVIKKEELAKYYVTMQQKPYIVAKGAAKCMADFAPYADELFSSDKDNSKINKEFFKRCVCYAIIFRQTDDMVYHAPWYTVNGFKNVIVPYAISKVVFSIPKGYELDYDLIWKHQSLYPSLREELRKAAEMAHDFFSNVPNGGIVTEYGKKEEAWQSFASEDLALSQDFKNDLVNSDFMKSKEKSSQKDDKETTLVQRINQIISLGKDYWLELEDEGKKRRLLTGSDMDLLEMAAYINVPSRYNKRIPTDRQFKAIWRIKERLEEAGVIVVPRSVTSKDN